MAASPDRDKIIGKVQALLNKAASSGFTAEAEALRNKADELMTKFIIEEHELRAARPAGEREDPIHHRFILAEAGSPMRQQLADLAHTVATHCRCRVVFYGLSQPGSRYRLSCNVYGFPTDVEYFTLMLTSLQSQMANELEPKPDPDMSVWENFTMLKQSGLAWPRVFEVMGLSFNDGRKELMKYRAWRNESGEGAERNVPPGTYVRSFAQGFANQVDSRLWQIRVTRDKKLDEAPGTALVLFDRSSIVDEYFAQENPGVRSVKTPEQRMVGSALRRGREAATRADLGLDRIGNAPRGQIGS